MQEGGGGGSGLVEGTASPLLLALCYLRRVQAKGVKLSAVWNSVCGNSGMLRAKLPLISFLASVREILSRNVH